MYNMLKQDIKEATLERSDSLPFLRTIKSEIDAKAKNDGNREATDKDVIAIVKRFVKNNSETIDALTSQNKELPLEISKERDILSRYLPKQISEDHLNTYIKEKIDQYGTDKKTMGMIMKDLNNDYPNQVDRKLASDMIKSML